MPLLAKEGIFFTNPRRGSNPEKYGAGNGI